MGLTAHSIHCRIEGRSHEESLAAVDAAVRRFLEARALTPVDDPGVAGRTVVILPGEGRWISIYDSDMEQAEALSASLSRDPGLPTVSLHILDSDIYSLELFEHGKSSARLSGGPAHRGVPRVSRAWLALMPKDLRREEVTALLSEKTDFAEHSVGALATLLGIDSQRCLRTAEDFRADLPPGARRLLFRTPAPAAEEPPRFRLMSPPAPVQLSVGEGLTGLSVSALNTGGAAHGLRVSVAGDQVSAGRLEIREIAVVHFSSVLPQDAPPQRIAQAPAAAEDGALEAVFPEFKVPGAPRSGSVEAVNAGWRVASVHVHFTGQALAPGAGSLSVVIAPAGDSTGAALASIPVEIAPRPRLPLRAAAGHEKAARELADPQVVFAMASLGPDRNASAAAVCAAIDSWLEAAPGEWVVTLQRDPMDFDWKPVRVDSVRRGKSKRWKEILQAVTSCHLLYGTIDPDPRTGIGRAAFVLDASRQPFGPARAVAPQFCCWAEIASAPPEAGAALRTLLEGLTAQARPLQAFLARWNFKTLSLGATLYETACGLGGPSLLTEEWCGRYLRGVGDLIWLSRPLTLHLDRAALQAAAQVRESDEGWWVELREPGGLDALERALAPVLAGQQEWNQARMR
jgi:hypothetical protein